MGFWLHENKRCCWHPGPEEHAHNIFSYFLWGSHAFVVYCASSRDTHACKHLETRAKPSHTLPLHVCNVIHWIGSVLQRSILLLGATLSDAACGEENPDWVPQELKGEEREGGGAQLSHWALVSDDGSLWGMPLIRLVGRARLRWGQVCMWVRMHQGGGIWVFLESISIAFYPHTPLLCSHANL